MGDVNGGGSSLCALPLLIAGVRMTAISEFRMVFDQPWPQLGASTISAFEMPVLRSFPMAPRLGRAAQSCAVPPAVAEGFRDSKWKALM